MIEPIATPNHTDLIRIVRKPQYGGNGNHRGIATYQNANNAAPGGNPAVSFADNIRDKTIPWVSLQTGLAFLAAV